MPKCRKYLILQALCIALGVSAALADDLLEHIPSKSAAILVVQRPAEFTRQLTDLIRKVTDGAAPANGQDLQLERLLDVPLSEEWWDHGSPLVLVLSRLQNAQSGLTVGFRRSDPGRFNMLGDPGPDGSRVRRLRGRASQHGFGTRIGEFIFLSPHKPTLERILRTTRPDSMAAALPPETREAINRCGVFARARIAPWRETIDRWMSILSAMAMVARAGPETEGAAASMEWFVDGVKTVLSEMEAVDICAKIEPDGISLSHAHSFTPSGRVINYLATTRSSGGDVWAGHGDRPFLGALAMDWKSDGDAELMTGMMDRVFSCPSVRKRTTPRQYKELRQSVQAWYRDLRGTSFVMCPPDARMLPLEIRGIYHFDDANTAIQQFLEMQKHNDDVVAAFLPGGGMVGTPSQRLLGARNMYEMRFDLADADASLVAMMENVYGKSPRCQVATLDKQHLTYLFTSNENGLAEFIAEAEQKPMSENADVRRVMARLPTKPNVVVLLDLARAMSAGLSMAPMAFAAGAGARPVPAGLADKPSMLGWALVADKRSITGHLFVSTDDARRFIKATERFRRDVAPPTASAAAHAATRPAQK